MKTIIRHAVTVCALFVILLGVYTQGAQAGEIVQGCTLTVGKIAAPDDGTLFDFSAEYSGMGDPGFSLPSGETINLFVPFAETLVVTEILPEGWALDDIDCETSPALAVSVDLESQSLMATCQTIGVGLCTFFNVRGVAPAAVPTLSEWGMIAAAAVLGLVGLFYAVRRRRAVRAS